MSNTESIVTNSTRKQPAFAGQKAPFPRATSEPIGKTTVGWVGLGLMGTPMASRLLGAGYDVAVFSRTPSTVEAWRDSGARCATSLEDVVAGASVVVTMLPFPQDVEDVYLGTGALLDRLPRETVAVDMSTSSPALARRLAEYGAERGIQVLDAPVSGGPFGAEQGALSVFVGGDQATYDGVRGMFDVLGSTVVHHGPAGSGQAAKLVNQVLVAGVTLGVCEAYALAETAGLDLDRVRESMRVGVAGSPLLDWAWPRLRSGDLEPGFKVEHMVKDLALAIDEVGAGDVAVPGASLVRDLYRAVAARSGGDRGTQALVQAARGTDETD